MIQYKADHLWKKKNGNVKEKKIKIRENPKLVKIIVKIVRGDTIKEGFSFT